MATIGIVGVGKIGLPISENLIKSGHRVVGYRRSFARRIREDRRRAGALAGRSRRAGRHRVVLPAVDGGARRRGARSARPHPFGAAGADRGRARLASGAGKARQIAPLREKGAIFIDGEVSGTPGMVAARKGVDLSRRRCRRLQEGRKRGRRLCRFVPLFRRVRRRKPGQARQQSSCCDQYRGDRRSDGAGAQSRRRCAADDQGDRDRQRRLDPVRHPRAVDGGAPFPAGAGHACRHCSIISG